MRNTLDCTLTVPTDATATPTISTSLQNGKTVVFSCPSATHTSNAGTAKRECKKGALDPPMATNPFKCHKSKLVLFNSFPRAEVPNICDSVAP